MRKQWIAAAALAVLAISGCAQTEDPASVPTPAATVEPTAEAVVGPERVFDGDCGALGSIDDLSADAGTPLAFVDEQRPGEMDYSTFPQVGGIHCVWSSAAETGLSVSAVVLPSRSFTEVRPTDTVCEPGAHCTFGAIESGFQLFGIVVQAGGDTATLQAAADSLAARMTESLAGTAVPAVYEPEGSWAPAVDCANLDEGRTIATLLNDPTLEGYAYGGDADPNTGFYVAYAASGMTHCDWLLPPGDGPSVSVDLMPGGAWRQADLEGLADAETVEVPGFVAAVVIGDTLHAFTEANRLDLTLDPAGTGLSLPDFYPAAAAIAAELDQG